MIALENNQKKSKVPGPEAQSRAKYRSDSGRGRERVSPRFLFADAHLYGVRRLAAIVFGPVRAREGLSCQKPCAAFSEPLK